MSAVPQTILQPGTKLQKTEVGGTKSIHGAESRDVGDSLSSEELTFISTWAIARVQACMKTTLIYLLKEGVKRFDASLLLLSTDFGNGGLAASA